MSAFLIEICLPGDPRGKGRPRFRVIGKGPRSFVSTYTDQETQKYESRLRAAGAAQMAMQEVFSGPLYVKVEAHMPIPASWSLKKRASAADGAIPQLGQDARWRQWRGLAG